MEFSFNKRKEIKMAKKAKKKVKNAFNKFLDKNKLTLMSVYIPKTLKAKLKQQAKKRDERMNAIVVRGLEKELKKAA